MSVLSIITLLLWLLGVLWLTVNALLVIKKLMQRPSWEAAGSLTVAVLCLVGYVVLLFIWMDLG